MLTSWSVVTGSGVDVDDDAPDELVVPRLALLVPERRQIVEEQRDHARKREDVEDQLTAEAAPEADRSTRLDVPDLDAHQHLADGLPLGPAVQQGVVQDDRHDRDEEARASHLDPRLAVDGGRLDA